MVTVLGGTGKTGSRVAANLRVRGVEVRAVSRSTAVPFDWSHEATWPAVLEGANAIYVIVDESPHGVDRLGRFLDLSNARGVQRIVLLSARDWIDADRADGLALEDLVRRSGMEWTILRPAWFAQNFDAPGYFADGIRRGRILHASGDGRCSFVDARDIAGVATAVLTEPGHHRREYALSGPDAITMSDVAHAIRRALGRAVEAVEVEMPVYERHLAGLGYDLEAIHAITYLDRAMKRGELDYVSDGVQIALGSPATSFARYALDHATCMTWRES